MTIRCTPAEFPALIRRRLAQDTEEAKKAALDACWMAYREARRLTKARGLIFTEEYHGSFYARPTPKGAVIGNDAPFALVIEKGRRPNRPGPPLAPILEWVEGKLGLSGDEAKEAAFHIREKIHRKGTKPHAILEQAANKLQEYHRNACRRRLQRRGAA